MTRRRRIGALAGALAGLAAGVAALAYPLDAGAPTGIARLEGYRLAQEGLVRGLRLAPGALLPVAAVELRLAQHVALGLPEPDAAFGAQIGRLLGAERPLYGVAVLDLSDPERPRYGESRATARFNPGSVGKLVVALGVLRALADAHPEDLEARRRVLRESVPVGDAFLRTDSHEVPIWKPGDPRIVKRRLREGDAGNLWTWLDWMLSASSNAAASTVMKHLLLLRHFGAEYPVAAGRAEAFLADTPRSELSALLRASLDAPVTAAGLDLESFRQGGFFTAEGKRRVPGGGSAASARELVRFLLHMEQGRLVDSFSSLELKRLLYMTERRIRYASSPALADAAVYFKSGSLYRCRPEPDFECRKYHGNVENVMNSVAIVEWPATAPRLHYLVAVTSNVLRRNSAVDHQTLATRIHRLIQAAHPAPPEAPAAAPESRPDSRPEPRR